MRELREQPAGNIADAILLCRSSNMWWQLHHFKDWTWEWGQNPQQQPQLPNCKSDVRKVKSQEENDKNPKLEHSTSFIHSLTCSPINSLLSVLSFPYSSSSSSSCWPGPTWSQQQYCIVCVFVGIVMVVVVVVKDGDVPGLQTGPCMALPWCAVPLPALQQCMLLSSTLPLLPSIASLLPHAAPLLLRLLPPLSVFSSSVCEHGRHFPNTCLFDCLMFILFIVLWEFKMSFFN